MFGAIALGSLLRPLELILFLVCTTRVLQWGSKKVQQQIEINGLGEFSGDPVFGDQSGRKAFPCSVALVFSFSEALPCSAAFWSAPMQRGAHFLWERESLREPWRVLRGDLLEHGAFGFVAPQVGGDVEVLR